MQDLLAFIKTGKIHDSIEIGMPIPEVKARLGDPTEIYGNSEVGYLHYDDIRIGYLKDVVDEIAFLFDQDSKPYAIDVPLLSDKAILIGGNTKIHEFIQILNYLEIRWKSCMENDFDYFFIKATSGVGIIFDLTTGNLFRISYAGSS